MLAEKHHEKYQPGLLKNSDRYLRTLLVSPVVTQLQFVTAGSCRRSFLFHSCVYQRQQGYVQESFDAGCSKAPFLFPLHSLACRNLL